MIDVYFIKLKTGDQIIGKLVDFDEESLVLEEPYYTEIIGNKIGLSNYCYFSLYDTFKFENKELELITPVKESIKTQYVNFIKQIKKEESLSIINGLKEEDMKYVKLKQENYYVFPEKISIH